MKTPRNIYQFLLLCLLLLAPDFLLGQKPLAFELFQNNTALQVILDSDIKNLVKGKHHEEYQAGKLMVIGKRTDSAYYDISIKSRGNVRKQVCYYPPIMLKFPKKQFKHHKVKMVFVCKKGKDAEQRLLKELLAYRLYEILTENSFQTSELNLILADKGTIEASAPAFVLEPIKTLARRLSSEIYEPKVFNRKILDQEALATFAFFQYLIYNTDWSFTNLHNMEILLDTVSGRVIPIPYDFDYSGWVDAPYAQVHENLPINHVSERHNKCHCLHEDMVEKTRLIYLDYKERMIEMIESHPRLDKSDRKDLVTKLLSFFKIMENPKLVRNIFSRNCKRLE